MTPTNRARLLVLLSLPVVGGMAFAVRPLPDASELLASLSFGELAFVIGVYVNAYRQEHRLSWREFLPPRVVGIWESMGPYLVIVGTLVAFFAIALLLFFFLVLSWIPPSGLP
jgi:hypothetical protein